MVRFEDQLRIIRSSKLFDAAWYYRRYADVRLSGLDAAEHYLRIGARIERDPSVWFSTRHYLAKNPDIAEAGLNPLVHYLTRGEAEGRRGLPVSAAAGIVPRLNEDSLVPAVAMRGRRPVLEGARSVLVCAHVAGAQLFGAERSLLDVLDGFAALGLNVHVAIPGAENGEYLGLLLDRAVEVIAFDQPWWRMGRPVDETVVAEYARIIAEHGIDAVHVNTIVLREPLIAARRAGVPGVVHVRELVAHDRALCEGIGAEPEAIVREVSKAADWLLANSRTTAAAFVGAPVHVVPNIVDVDVFDIEPPRNSGALRIGMISSNVPKKGVGDFIELADRLSGDLPEARLRLIGPENALVGDLKARQRDGGIPANVEFVDYLDEPQRAVAAVDVVVNLSNFQESFGRVVLEAMAARRPVVAYRWGALPELVVDGATGFLVPYRDVGAVAERVLEICRSPALLKALGEAGRERAVQEYGRQRLTTSLGEAYAKILHAPRRMPVRPVRTRSPGPIAASAGPDAERALIAATGLFDPEFYLGKYADVRASGADPLAHFVRHGAREGRQPNAFFSPGFYRERHLAGDTATNPLVHYITTPGSEYFETSPGFDGRHYLRSYPDVAASGLGPLEHFLSIGLREGRSPVATSAPASSGTGVPAAFDTRTVRAAVIVPVFNAHDEVLDCLHALLRHTRFGNGDRLIVLDDCSPDPRIRSMLDAFAAVPGVQVIHNAENLGYTRNVNKGCELAGADDVVLLNSDTRVGPHWLRNLKLAAYRSQKVGTVTAVSNNAGAFSVPEPGSNELPEGLDVDMVARLVADATGHATVDVPTGNGFCFYIKRPLLDAIGAFDAVNFPRGYGEENEFCMRALSAGWFHLVDTGTYVFHVRSASFKQDKHALIERGVARVREMFPGYAGATRVIGESTTFRLARGRIAEAFADARRHRETLRPRIMYVLSTRTGGTPQTNRDLMRAVADVYDCYALRCDRQTIEVLVAGESDYEVVRTFRLREPIGFATHVSREYDDLVQSILVEYSIDLLHIRHLAWHSLNLVEVARGVGVAVVNSFHDFYAICPTVNLIDRAGVYHPTGVQAGADNPLWKNDVTAVEMTAAGLARWQAMTQAAVAGCDAYVTTCHSARQLLADALPLLAGRGDDFHVIPHGRDFEGFSQLAVDGEIGPGEPLRVLLPGNIGLSKGSELIKRVRQLDVDGLIEFHLLGVCDPDLAADVVDHGRYRREEFAERVAEVRPHVAAVLSIWPETYCHTLTESWACGLPVVGVRYGAVEERIVRHGGGWLADNDAERLYRLLLDIRADREDRARKIELVGEWQRGYGRTNTTDAMSVRYLALYRSVLIGRRGLSEAGNKRTGFVMKGRFPDVPATAYVRLVDWTAWFEREYAQPVDYLHWSALLRADVAAYGRLVIQRDAIPAHRVAPAIATLDALGIPYTYEIDDNLFDVPVSVDPGGIYAEYRPALERLCAGAAEVHVTNEVLADVIRPLNPRVRIRPNRLSASRWFGERPAGPEAAGGTDAAPPPGGELRVLYFGSRTHAEDLELALEGIRLARASGRDIRLFLVGVADCGPEEDEEFVFRLSPPDARFDRFVPWLRGIAGSFDLGVAPLVDRDFSTAKSYIKALEYLALGLPVICSESGPYRELRPLSGAVPGALTFVPNRAEAWAAALLAARPRTADGFDPGALLRDFVIDPDGRATTAD